VWTGALSYNRRHQSYKVGISDSDAGMCDFTDTGRRNQNNSPTRLDTIRCANVSSEIATAASRVTRSGCSRKRRLRDVDVPRVLAEEAE
jgi:hypothetical protein